MAQYFTLGAALFLELSSLSIPNLRGGRRQGWGSGECKGLLVYQHLFFSSTTQPGSRHITACHYTARQKTSHRIKGEKRELSPNCPLQVMPGPLGCCFPPDWDPNSLPSWVFLPISFSISNPLTSTPGHLHMWFQARLPAAYMISPPH